MSLPKIIPSLALGLALLLQSGCASTVESMVKKPKAELSSVNVKDAGLKGATILFGVQVTNPNPFKMRVDGLKYDLAMSDQHVTSGEIDTPSEVPANGSAVVVVPVALQYGDLFSSITESLKKESVPYTLKGSAQLGLFSLPFDHSGELKLRP